MTASATGPRTAQLVFAYPGGQTSVVLDGAGIVSSDTGGTKDRETYYACSAGGDAAGLLPIALAAFAARRRRRAPR